MSDAQFQNGGARDRKLRNFLLDAPFQLKFAAYFVGITVVISALVGAFLIRTTDSLFAQISESVESRTKAAQTSRELGTCTLNNELTKNIDDPDFASKLAERSRAIDAAYEAEQAAAQSQRAAVRVQQQRTLYILSGVLVAFIALIALTAIVITHRIVGPLFRIKRMATEIAAGKLQPPPYGLRPSDELQVTFETFSQMVAALRAQTESDLNLLKQGDAKALETLKSDLESRINR